MTVVGCFFHQNTCYTNVRFSQMQNLPDGQNPDTPVLSDTQHSLSVNKSPTTVVIQQKDR
jgi:hypothetical protein